MLGVIFLLFLLIVMMSISPIFGVFLIGFVVVAGIYSFVGKNVGNSKIDENGETINYENNKEKTGNKKGIAGAIAVISVIVVLIVVIVGLSSGSSPSGGSSKTCQSCHREYTDSTNKNYIRHTNMCRLCYRNYCYAIGQTPSNYDK